MKYLLLIHLDEATQPGPDDLKQYVALADDLKAKGQWIAGVRLEPSSAAKTLRKGEITDGPFAEACEQLGGFYLVDVPTLAEAQAVAARIPVAQRGTIEVRPLMATP